MGPHTVAFMGVNTLMKPLPSSNIIGFPNKVRMHVEDSGLHPFQNSTMLPTGCFHQLNRCLRDNCWPMAETCRFSQQHSTRTGTIEEQVSWGPCCCFRFWCDWRGKEDPSVNPRNTANLLSREKAREWTQYLTEWRRPQEQERVIDRLIYYFVKLGNSETRIITFLLSHLG